MGGGRGVKGFEVEKSLFFSEQRGRRDGKEGKGREGIRVQRESIDVEMDCVQPLVTLNATTASGHAFTRPLLASRSCCCYYLDRTEPSSSRAQDRQADKEGITKEDHD